MSGFSVSAVLAVFAGAFLLPVLLIPYVVWTYRRRGTLGYGHALIAAGAVVYFMAVWTYTILPLPDAAELACVDGGPAPQLVPFASLSDIDLAANGWRDPAMWQLVLNVCLFIPFGMLVRHLVPSLRPVWVVAAGAATSLLVELTQLTGIWGLYPCAYRTFDVDDLLTNTVGAAVGVAFAPVLRLVPGQQVLPQDRPRVVGRGRRVLGMAVDYVSVIVVSFAIYLPLALAARDGRWFGDDVPYTALYAWVTLAVAVVVLLGVPWFGGGVTPGQLTTFVRPVRVADQNPPRRAAMLIRWACGSGGYFVLLSLSAITGRPALSWVATAWLVVSVIVVVAVHPRGLSGYASGLTVADARDPSVVASRARAADPRSLARAVVFLLTALYLAITALTAVGTLVPAVGLAFGLLGALALVAATLALLPFLVATGVITVRREGLSAASVLPLGAAVGLIGLVVLLGVALAGGIAWLMSVTLALVAVTGYLGFLFVAFLLYGQWYARRPPDLPVDAVVVLGSRVFDDRVPPLLAGRIDRGIEVLRASWQADPDAATVLVCSGGRGPDETVAEGDAMADYALARGVPQARVLRETASHSTQENLTLSKALLQRLGLGTSMVVATNDYHAFRAGIVAREQGVSAQVVGAPTARYYFPSAVLREFVGVLARNPLLHVGVATALALGVGALVQLLLG